jgi:hypothetical protein
VVDPILQKAGVAMINNFPQAPIDFTSTNAFPFSSGGPGLTLAEGVILAKEAHAKKIDVATFGGSEGPALAQAISGLLKATYGFGTCALTPVPPTATDFSPIVNSALKSCDSAAIILTSAPATQFIQTARKLSYNQPIASSAVGAPPSALETLGASASNLYIVGAQLPYSSDTTVPGLVQFNTIMKQYGAKGLAYDDSSIAGYLAISAVASSARDLGSNLSRSSFLNKWSTTSSYSSGGITPDLDFTKKFTGLQGAFPRMANPSVVFEKWTPGTGISALGSFQYPFGQ